MNFRTWLNEYEREYNQELKLWQRKNRMGGIIPQGFDKELIKQ